LEPFDAFDQPHMFPELRLELTPRALRDQLETLPLHERKIIERAWECVDRHYRATRTRLERFDLEHFLKDYIDKPKSLSSFDRAHRKYPLLLPWPIEYGMVRPWEQPDVTPLVMKPEDEIAAGQLILDEHGAYVLEPNGVKRPARLIAGSNGTVMWMTSSVAAAVSGFALLDGMDGKLDGAIHWCHVLAEVLAPHLTM
jgi:hypothetical protein